MYFNFELQFGLNDEDDSGKIFCLTNKSIVNIDFRHRIRIWRIRTLWKFQRILFWCFTRIRKIRQSYSIFCLLQFGITSTWKCLCSIRNVTINCWKIFVEHFRLRSTRDDEAMRAFLKFNSRYYAGRMIQCEFVDIRNWSEAICGERKTKNSIEIELVRFSKVCLKLENVPKDVVVTIYMSFEIHRIRHHDIKRRKEKFIVNHFLIVRISSRYFYTDFLLKNDWRT